MRVTTSVRNDNDTVFRIVREGLLSNEYRTLSRYNTTMSKFDFITCFAHEQNRKRRTFIRFTSTANPTSSSLSAMIREEASAHEVVSWCENPKQSSLLLCALERAKLAYAQSLRNEVEKYSTLLWIQTE